jgi:hypothetical protein
MERRVPLRFGRLKRRTPEYTGERHMIVTREVPKQGDQQWVEFEEVPGPEPEPLQILTCGGHQITSRLDIILVSARLQPEQCVGL